MDKFVTRAPTWKVKSSSITNSSVSAGAKKVVRKSLSQPLSDSRGNISANNSSSSNGRRLSILDEKLLQIFAAPPDQPLVDCAAANNSRIEGAGNSANPNRGGIVEQFLLEGELSDYISVPQAKKQEEKQGRRRTASQSTPSKGVHFPDDLEKGSSSQPTTAATSPVRRLQWIKLPATAPNGPPLSSCANTTPSKHNTALMARIQRDLDSPSASVRMRAIKAMKSPTKSAYAVFDVQHAEQSLISAEERRTPPPPPTIQELMRDIVVYVEVRTGEDNRSAGVKKVISALGARVNDKLFRGTTHVIFKDGLLSTYKKAKQLNIPVVSILWIEACKTQRKICDPIEFPISNVDRYENPELYDKLKRHKSMQPGSECNKRVRAKPGAPKDVTPKTGATSSADATLKKCSTFIENTPNKKTDISHFFKRLGSAKKTPKTAIAAVSGLETPPPPATVTGVNFVAESPATQLLNRMTSNCYTPVSNVLIKPKTPAPALSAALEMYDEESTDAPVYSGGSPAPKPRDIKKSLNFTNTAATIKDQIETIEPKSAKRVSNRRRTSVLKSNIDATIISIGEMSISQIPTLDTNISVSPALRRTTRRRSSMHVQTNMSVEGDLTTANTPLAKQNDLTAITENVEKVTAENSGDDEVRKSALSTKASLPKRTARRRTTYTSKAIDISEISMDNAVDSKEEHSKEKSTQRRTLYTPLKMEESLATVSLESDEPPVDTESTVTLVPTESQPTSAHAFASSTRMRNDESTLSTMPNESVLTPIPPKVVSLTRNPNNEEITILKPGATTSLLEQYSNTPIFNSERKPGRRRTLFDVSMDIITQRLQNINQNSARRSIVPAPTPAVGASYEEMRRNSTENETPISVLPEVITTSNLQSQIDGLAKSETQIEINTINNGEICQVATEASECEKEVNAVVFTTPVIKKKRKLFMHNDSLLVLTPPAAIATPPKNSSTTSNGSFLTPDIKRRRKVPLSQPQSENKLACSRSSTSSGASTSSVSDGTKRPQRRSTMDFQTVQRTKATLATAKRTTTMPKESPISVCGVSKNQTGCISASATTDGSSAKKNVPFLVYTNMHKEQIEVIREAIKTLGGFQLEYCISDATTHVVSLEPRRTLNLLRALARGLWILDYNWILASVRNGKWLSEEHYELRDFSRAVEICRAERQAFGNIYKCELFSGLGLFYISSRCGPISKENLTELIVLCGGRIADQRKRAKYILGDANRALEEKVYITPFWILDSITQMQLQPLKKYATAEILTTTTTHPKPSEVHASQPRVQKTLQLVQQSQI